MEIYISINGVLRNLIQKFDYHYQNCYIDIESEEKEDDFEYRIKYPIKNDNLLDHYAFHSKEEYENFLFIEYALEIFGHAGISYPSAMSDLNKLIFNNTHHNFTLVGLDELGKARPATFFFLSKNGYLGSCLKFIKSKDIDKEWKKCNVWITDNRDIIEKCPQNKIVIKFCTDYNRHFYHDAEINNLNIELPCSKSWEKITTSTLTKLLKNVGQIIAYLKTSKDQKNKKFQKAD